MKRKRSDRKRSLLSAASKRRIWRNRAVAVIWLLTVLFIYVRTDSFLGPALLGGTVFLYICCLILPLLTGRYITCGIDMPGRAAKDEPVDVMIRFKSSRGLPVLRGIAVFRMSNVLTGEEKYIDLGFSTVGTGSCDQVMTFRSPWCGRCDMEACEAYCMDPLAVRKVRRDIGADAHIIVMPGIGDITTDEQTREAADMESFTYSQTRKGTDVSETFSIREYQPGDSIKRIHWKLTYKTGDVMVREASYPIYNSMLILLESGFSDPSDLKPEWMDAMAEVALSLGAALTEQNIGFDIGIYDHAEGKLHLNRIDSEEGLWAAAGAVLGAKRTVTETDAVTHFLENFTGQPFAHVVYVTAGSEQPDMERLASESIVTVLRCGSEGVTEGDIAEYGFLPDKWESDLQYIRI